MQPAHWLHLIRLLVPCCLHPHTVVCLRQAYRRCQPSPVKVDWRDDEAPRSMPYMLQTGHHATWRHPAWCLVTQRLPGRPCKTFTQHCCQLCREDKQIMSSMIGERKQRVEGVFRTDGFHVLRSLTSGGHCVNSRNWQKMQENHICLLPTPYLDTMST